MAGDREMTARPFSDFGSGYIRRALGELPGVSPPEVPPGRTSVHHKFRVHLDPERAGVALSPGCADPTGPKALRASMGAVFRVPLSGFDAPAGRRIALVPRGGTPLPELDLSGDLVFVLGAERDGLPQDVLEGCDARASIPQHGDAESLNVAMAGTVALYELARRSG